MNRPTTFRCDECAKDKVDEHALYICQDCFIDFHDLKAQNALMRDALNAVEWLKHRNRYMALDGWVYCPLCNAEYLQSREAKHHAPDCLRQRALEEYDE